MLKYEETTLPAKQNLNSDRRVVLYSNVQCASFHTYPNIALRLSGTLYKALDENVFNARVHKVQQGKKVELRDLPNFGTPSSKADFHHRSVGASKSFKHSSYPNISVLRSILDAPGLVSNQTIHRPQYDYHSLLYRIHIPIIPFKTIHSPHTFDPLPMSYLKIFAVKTMSC